MVFLSQIQQGLAIKTAIEYWRSTKPRCMGTLYWQINDTYPVQLGEPRLRRRWKLLHYMAKRFFLPVAAFIVPDKEIRRVRRSWRSTTAMRDVTVEAEAARRRDLDGQVEVAVHRFPAWSNAGRRRRTLGQLRARARSARTASSSSTGRPSDGSAGRSHFSPLPYKAHRLQAA